MNYLDPDTDVYASIYDEIGGGTEDQIRLYERIVGDGQEENPYAEVSPYNPLEQLARTPVLSLKDAVAKMAMYCKDDADSSRRKAEAYAATHAHVEKVQRTGAGALTADDIAVLYMYTMETDFYRMLNNELSLGYGKSESYNEVEHYLPVTKLLISAMSKLPQVAMGVKLFRGVKLPHTTVFSTGAEGTDVQVNDVVTWQQFTSCSTSPEVLKEFLGDDAAAGERTVCQIIAVTGGNIKAYSAIPREDEVVLPPGSRFVVEKITPWKHGLTEVRMRQILPDGSGGDAAGAAAALGGSPVYADVSDYVELFLPKKK